MTSQPDRPTSYAAAGVDTDAAGRGLAGLIDWVGRTASLRSGMGETVVPNGFFASAMRLRDDLLIAISTDGVGSKSLVAQAIGSYEGIGWDCVAVNVNDVVCTGAEPIVLVDYISLQQPHEDLLEALGKGLHDGAQRARVAIVGGELSQHPDSLTGPREGYAFDISGTCVGVLDGREPITGSAIVPGDVILGLPANGVHANGLTLARMVLGQGVGGFDRTLPECGRTVGEELLRPTHIYVPEALGMLGAGVDIHGFAHISGDGFLNLLRFDADVTYRLDSMEEPEPIFGVIQRDGGVDIAEMFRVFNMGVGFCVVVPEADADAAIAAAASAGGRAYRLGTIAAGPRQVELPQYGLIGRDGQFEEAAG